MSDWNPLPSKLWMTRRGPYGFEYKCTECGKVSETFLKPSTRMHHPSCDRVERGETRKPLKPVEEPKSKRRGRKRSRKR